MSFSDFDITCHTRKGNFRNQIDHPSDWVPIEKAIAQYCAPVFDTASRLTYPGLLLFKMLLAGI
ncbi:MAG: hypothetical protein ABL887_02045 [Nitrosomonas sp.]